MPLPLCPLAAIMWGLMPPTPPSHAPAQRGQEERAVGLPPFFSAFPSCPHRAGRAVATRHFWSGGCGGAPPSRPLSPRAPLSPSSPFAALRLLPVWGCPPPSGGCGSSRGSPAALRLRVLLLGALPLCPPPSPHSGLRFAHGLLRGLLPPAPPSPPFRPPVKRGEIPPTTLCLT